MNPMAASDNRPARQPQGSGSAPELPAQGGGTDWKRILIRWAPPALLGATGLSLVIHLCLGVVAAFILVGGGIIGQAGGGGESGPVGVAVMTEAEFGSVMQAAGMNADTPEVANVPTTTLPGSEVEITVSDVGLGGAESGNLADGAGALTSGMGAGDITGGPGLGGSGSGGGAASFFGVEARGTRFAYIVDISGSMDIGVGVGELKRIDVMKTELGKSLAALLENAYFFVALFSTDAKAMGGRAEWVGATDAGKAWARKTVPLIVAEGATEPINAFKMAFRLRPKPDAIYFMTDGEFLEDYVQEIARLNAEWRIPIHCITFVSREGEKSMKKIAEQSGGTYSHVTGPGG